MKNKVVVLAWAFVLVIAGYDVYFAWQYRAGFDIWEMNPVARWVAQDFGLTSLFILKIAFLGFGMLVAVYCRFRRHYLEIPYTLAVSGIHLVLSLHYLMGHMIPI